MLNIAVGGISTDTARVEAYKEQAVSILENPVIAGWPSVLQR